MIPTYVINLNVEILPDILPNFRTWKFPGGEVGIECEVSTNAEYPVMLARLNTSDDIIALMLALNTLKRKPDTLYVPYLPYARQDRRVEEKGAFSLKVIGQLLDNLGFKNIVVFDPHSDVTSGVFRNTELIVKDCISFIKEYQDTPGINKFDAIMAPDYGAVKRTQRASEALGLPMLVCQKNRVSRDEIRIVPPPAHELTRYKNILVYDDICDGGGTFVALAKAIENLFTNISLAQHSGVLRPRLNLFVTHGIFSKGNLSNFNGLFDVVMTTNSWQTFGSSWTNWSGGKFIVKNVFPIHWSSDKLENKHPIA